MESGEAGSWLARMPRGSERSEPRSVLACGWGWGPIRTKKRWRYETAARTLLQPIVSRRQHLRKPLRDEGPISQSGLWPRQPGHARELARNRGAGIFEKPARDL